MYWPVLWNTYTALSTLVRATPAVWLKSIGEGYGLPKNCQPLWGWLPRVRPERVTVPVFSVPVRSSTAAGLMFTA